MHENLARIAAATVTRRGVVGAALALPAIGPAAARRRRRASTQMQFLHASADAQAVDVYADGVRVAMALAYGERTELAAYDRGPMRIAVVPVDAGPESPIFVLDETLDAGRSYLFALGGAPEETNGRASPHLHGFLFGQDRSRIPDRTVMRTTVIHLDPETPELNVGLQAPDAAGRGFSGLLIAERLPYGQQSAPVEVPADTAYNVVTWDPRGEAASGGVLQLDASSFDSRELSQIVLTGFARGLTIDAPTGGRWG